MFVFIPDSSVTIQKKITDLQKIVEIKEKFTLSLFLK